MKNSIIIIVEITGEITANDVLDNPCPRQTLLCHSGYAKAMRAPVVGQGTLSKFYSIKLPIVPFNASRRCARKTKLYATRKSFNCNVNHICEFGWNLALSYFLFPVTLGGSYMMCKFLQTDLKSADPINTSRKPADIDLLLPAVYSPNGVVFFWFAINIAWM